MKIYTIRHGETDWNVARRIQGRVDIPLNADGIIQAQNAAVYFRNAGIQKIYTSDLKRARETAEQIGKIIGVQDIVPDRDLREMHCGDAESLFLDNLDQQPEIKKVFSDLDAGCYDSSFPGGESLYQVAQRFMGFLKKLPHREQTILIVSHGGVLRSFLNVFVGQTNVHVPNCGGIIFDWNENNEFSHVEIYSTGKTRTLF